MNEAAFGPMIPSGNGGTAFRIGEGGLVEEIVRDDQGLVSAKAVGRDFLELFDDHSRDKAERFFREAWAKSAALSWEMNLVSGERIVTLNFFGVRRGASLVVVASAAATELFSLYENLLTIVNEQANETRAAQKRLKQHDAPRSATDEALLEDFMKVNNQLINAQRELTKKHFELERQEARFRRLVSELRDGVVVVDAAGAMRFMNPAAERVFSPAGLVGLGAPFPFLDHLREDREILLDTGEGKRIALEPHAVEVLWESRPAKLVTLRDVTEKRELELLKEDVERIMRHDLKSPLAGIISLSQAVGMDETLTAEQREFIGMIERSGNEMLDQINDSLDLYKMETGTYRLTPQPVDARYLVERVFRDQGRMIGRKRLMPALLIEGRTAGPGETFFLWGEPALLRSLFSNLIKNAIEASPPGGDISVAFSTEDELSVVRFNNRGEIPDAIRERFFHKYATSGKSGGTGLGAYSARLIAKTHGGGVEACSSPESGVTISVRLPRQSMAE